MLYINGDEFIDLGTKKELSDRQNISIAFITYLMTPSNRKRATTNKYQEANRLLIIKIGEEE